MPGVSKEFISLDTTYSMFTGSDVTWVYALICIYSMSLAYVLIKKK
jgi:hypothetical protein